MGVLVLLMLTGYLCAKLGVTGQESNRHTSRLVLNVLLVGTILNSVVNIQPSLSNAEILKFFLLIVAEFLVLGAVAWLFPGLLRIKGGDRGVSRTILLFMNNGFVGLPVVQVAFGTEAVFYASLSNIPFNILLYTIGAAQIRGGGDEKFDIRDMLNTPMVATLAAIILFLLRVHIPAVLADTISSLAAATIPMSMLVIGTSLGGIPLRSAFGDWRAYVLSFIKLIVCPVAVWAALRWFVTNPMMLGVLIILAACPTAMILTVLCIQYRRDEALASKTIFLSTVFSAATIPFILWLLM
jgi:predicted permease